jgi:hypothetical protein
MSKLAVSVLTTLLLLGTYVTAADHKGGPPREEVQSGPIAPPPLANEVIGRTYITTASTNSLQDLIQRTAEFPSRVHRAPALWSWIRSPQAALTRLRATTARFAWSWTEISWVHALSTGRTLPTPLTRLSTRSIHSR